MRDMTLAEVATELGVSYSTILRWRRKGRFPSAYRAGRNWLVPAEDAQNVKRPKIGRPSKGGKGEKDA